MELSLDPTVLLLLAVSGGLYARAIRVCHGRGLPVSKWQQAVWWAGLALMAIALISPVDGLGDELLAAHMAQHLLIADLAVPLLLAGIRSPVLLFYLPRSALVVLARRRTLRRILARLAHPLVAIPVYVLTLYAWHLDFMFQAGAASELAHGLQHQSFVAISVLVWWSALEPNRRRLRGELWKIGHILAARLAGMFLGMAFVVMRVVAYPDVYGEGAYGLTPLSDQQLAGAMMLSLDFFVVIAALAFFFWHASEDDRRAQSDPPAAGRPGSRAEPRASVPGGAESAPGAVDVRSFEGRGSRSRI